MCPRLLIMHLQSSWLLIEINEIWYLINIEGKNGTHLSQCWDHYYNPMLVSGAVNLVESQEWDRNYCSSTILHQILYVRNIWHLYIQIDNDYLYRLTAFYKMLWNLNILHTIVITNRSVLLQLIFTRVRYNRSEVSCSKHCMKFHIW